MSREDRVIRVLLYGCQEHLERGGEFPALRGRRVGTGHGMRSRAWQCLRSYGFSDRERDENCALAIAWKHTHNPAGTEVAATGRTIPRARALRRKAGVRISVAPSSSSLVLAPRSDRRTCARSAAFHALGHSGPPPGDVGTDPARLDVAYAYVRSVRSQRQPSFRRGAGLSRQSGRRPARRQLQARRSEERVPDFDPRWGRASVPQRARHSRPCQEVTTTAVGRSGRSTAARPGVAEAGGDPDSLPVRTSWESAPTTSAGACSARRSRDTADRSGATAFSCKQPRFDAGGAAAGCCCRTTWAANSTASS